MREVEDSETVRRVKALASEPRLRILEKLSDMRERTYSELIQETKMPSSSLNFHLKLLQESGFIQKMPLGKYQITENGYRALLGVQDIERRLRGQEMPEMWVVRD